MLINLAPIGTPSNLRPSRSRSSRRRAVGYRTVGAPLLAVVVLAGACSGGGQVDPGNFSVQSHVGHLPTPQRPTVLVAADLDAASEAAGVQRPDDADSEEGHDWLLALTVNTEYEVFVPTPVYLTQSFGREGGDELGWDLTDVRTFAEDQAPVDQTLIVTGDFDDDTLAADLEGLGDGVFSAGSGPDRSIDPQQTTPLRPTGIPLRLARDGEVIMVGAEEQAVRDWLTGAERDTVADDDAISNLAAALDDAGVYAAAILTQAGPLQPPPGLPESGADRLSENWQEWAITETFEVFGVGWAMADGEPVVAAAYHFSDADSAERAADQVQRVWTDGFTVNAGPISQMFIVQDVEQDGAVVIATLHLGPDGVPHHAFDMMHRQEITTGYLQP